MHLVRFASSARPDFLNLLRLVWKSDIVHLAGPAMLPLALAWLLRKKAVIVHHGYQSVCPDGSLIHFADERVCCNSFASGDARDCVRCRAARLGWLRGTRQRGARVSAAVVVPPRRGKHRGEPAR